MVRVATMAAGSSLGHVRQIDDTTGADRTCDGSTTRRSNPNTASAATASSRAAIAATGTSTYHRHRSRGVSHESTVRMSRITSASPPRRSHRPLVCFSPSMQDLTTGSLTGHLLRTTTMMLVGMIFQTLYLLVDLFWVSGLGADA